MNRVANVTDVVAIGDRVKVKVISVDEMGRVNLSMKQADPSYDASNDRRAYDRPPRTPRPHGGRPPFRR